jgi:hypothetical protein
MSDVVSLSRFILGNRSDGLIILQVENLVTRELPVPGNRKRGSDRGISDIRFSELYRPMAKADDRVIGLIRAQAGTPALASREFLETATEDVTKEYRTFNFLSFTGGVMFDEYLFVLSSWQKTTVRPVSFPNSEFTVF